MKYIQSIGRWPQWYLHPKGCKVDCQRYNRYFLWQKCVSGKSILITCRQYVSSTISNIVKYTLP